MTALLRTAQADDAPAIWRLLQPAIGELTGMTSLPSSPERARAMCEHSAATVADLATGSFDPTDGETRRILFVALDAGAEADDGAERGGGRLLGITGVSIKQAVPNLAVQVTTSGDGMGLIMRSVSAPWSRTELDSSFLGPHARGKGMGTLLSRGRFMLLQIVRRQLPSTVASHLRGVFDPDGTAPFWPRFGGRFAPHWATSPEAEAALESDPSLLIDMAGHILELTAPVLESLGAVNAQSLPAFRMLRAEGLEPNGMYDPIDGGPTVVADIAQTASARFRRHGRVELDRRERRGAGVDGLVSVATVDRFRVIRARYRLGEAGRVVLSALDADALGVADGDLVAVNPLEGVL